MIINSILLSIFQNFLLSSFSSLESFRQFLSLSRILLAISIEFFRHFPFFSILYTYICQYITKHATGVQTIFTKFRAQAELETSKKIKRIHVDEGTEFLKEMKRDWK